MMRRALSLIEILIGMAFGLITLFVAFAGFRLCAQTVAVVNRMSLENQLLRAAMIYAVGEVDRWDFLDAPGHQPLRTLPTASIDESAADPYAGLAWSDLPQPFTPIQASWHRGIGSADASFAYDGRWLPHDPKCWFRGDAAILPVEQSGSRRFFHDVGSTPTSPHDFYLDQYQFGNPALQACAQDDLVLTRGTPPQSLAAIHPLGALHRWYPLQHKGLGYALGWYGWFDYLPANAILHYADTGSGSRARLPWALRASRPVPGLGAHGTLAYSGDHEAAGGAPRGVDPAAFLYGSALGITSGGPAITPQVNRRMAGQERNTVGSVKGFNDLVEAVEIPSGLMAQPPATWPEVSVSIQRLKTYSRSETHCLIRINDPMTGQAVELAFQVGGTTLRGARLSRGLDR